MSKKALKIKEIYDALKVKIIDLLRLCLVPGKY